MRAPEFYPSPPPGGYPPSHIRTPRMIGGMRRWVYGPRTQQEWLDHMAEGQIDVPEWKPPWVHFGARYGAQQTRVLPWYNQLGPLLRGNLHRPPQMRWTQGALFLSTAPQNSVGLPGFQNQFIDWSGRPVGGVPEVPQDTKPPPQPTDFGGPIHPAAINPQERPMFTAQMPRHQATFRLINSARCGGIPKPAPNPFPGAAFSGNDFRRSYRRAGVDPVRAREALRARQAGALRQQQQSAVVHQAASNPGTTRLGNPSMWCRLFPNSPACKKDVVAACPPNHEMVLGRCIPGSLPGAPAPRPGVSRRAATRPRLVATTRRWPGFRNARPSIARALNPDACCDNCAMGKSCAGGCGPSCGCGSCRVQHAHAHGHTPHGNPGCGCG